MDPSGHSTGWSNCKALASTHGPGAARTNGLYVLLPFHLPNVSTPMGGRSRQSGSCVTCCTHSGGTRAEHLLNKRMRATLNRMEVGAACKYRKSAPRGTCWCSASTRGCRSSIVAPTLPVPCSPRSQAGEPGFRPRQPGSPARLRTRLQARSRRGCY